MELCWINGAVLPAEQATVNVLDHGVLYGDGVFEGLRFRHGQVFRLGALLARLSRSARAIGLRLPMSQAQMAQALDQLIGAYTEATGQDHGYIRLVLTRGVGKLGIDPASCPVPGLFMIAGELSIMNPRIREEGAVLITASTRKLGPAGLDPRIKSLNYLSNIMARMEATAAGADEAVMLNSAGNVAEGTVVNIFIVNGAVLSTPPPDEGALEGITRGAVMEVARRLGMEVLQKRLAPYDMYTADEIFLTGTGAGLVPVRRIDGRDVGRGAPWPVFAAISQGFEDLVEQETSRPAPAETIQG